MPGEHLDLSSDDANVPPVGPGEPKRPFLGIHFTCCGVYARIISTGRRPPMRGIAHAVSSPCGSALGRAGPTSVSLPRIESNRGFG